MAIALALALAADLAWGEPHVKWHPVALVGKAMAATARKLRQVGRSPLSKRVMGGLLVIGFSGGTYLLAGRAIAMAAQWGVWSGVLVEAGLVWLSISVGELVKTARRIDSMIEAGEIDRARVQLSSLVGRDTGELDSSQIRAAAIESVAENLVDAGVAPIFYLLLGGAPLAITYRVVNTLDSMFGYKTEEFIDFGWASARLDDVASWVPARLAVLVISLTARLSSRRGFTPLRGPAGKSDGRSKSENAAQSSEKLGVPARPALWGNKADERRREGRARAGARLKSGTFDHDGAHNCLNAGAGPTGPLKSRAGFGPIPDNAANGVFGRAFRVALSHGRRHASPNSGLPIAAIAGALRIRLGGARVYQGTQTDYGYFGEGDRPISSDIVRQAELLAKGSILLTGMIVMAAAVWLKGPIWPSG